jgi:hypothetical protein
MQTVRYCWRCRGMADHIKAPPRRLRWRWALFWPLLWLLDRAVGAPLCLRCLRRDEDLVDY